MLSLILNFSLYKGIHDLLNCASMLPQIMSTAFFTRSRCGQVLTGSVNSVSSHPSMRTHGSTNQKRFYLQLNRKKKKLNNFFPFFSNLHRRIRVALQSVPGLLRISLFRSGSHGSNRVIGHFRSLFPASLVSAISQQCRLFLSVVIGDRI